MGDVVVGAVQALLAKWDAQPGREDWAPNFADELRAALTAAPADEAAVSESVKAAITEFRGRCNEFAFSNGDDEWLDAHQAVLERAILATLAGEK